MKTIKGGITAPQGFSASAIHSGIKKSGKPDLALINSESLANAAGVFTTNKVKAAPILVSQLHIEDGKAKAIIINSGNANACTGEKGLEDAKQMACAAASALRVPYSQVLVASTGVIGKLLPIKSIMNGVLSLRKKLSKTGGGNVAEAILTTDTRKKEIAVQIKIGKKTVTIGGIVKGAGMIHPEMDVPQAPRFHPGQATMLGFITTDAEVPSKMLNKMLKKAVDESFNSITIDKDTSTNDCVFVLANGMSKCGKLNKKGEDEFYNGLEYVCKYLAKEIARDGEGATKLIEVRVMEAKNDNDAHLISRSVAGSNLVKGAFFGEDPNFIGRVMAAIGCSGAEIQPDQINVFVGDNQLVKDGKIISYSVPKVKKYINGKEIIMTIEIGIGSGMATSWGCDLTYDYVKINAEYTT